MNLVDVLWPILGAISGTLGLIHGMTWLNQKSRVDHLALSLMCLAIGASSMFELWAMHAKTPHEWAMYVRWGHVVVAIVIIEVVHFVHASFHAGRTWLAIAIVALRLACLVPNFYYDNLNFIEVTGLGRIDVWGSGPIAVPIGIFNPAMVLGQVGNLLLAVYVIDVLVTVWRRNRPNERRSAVLICGSLLLTIVIAPLWTLAVARGLFNAPLIFVPLFVGVLLVISYDLGGGILHAGNLSRDLTFTRSELESSERRIEREASERREAQERFRVVVEAVQTALLMVGTDGTIAFANPYAQAIFGYAHDELVGMNVDALVPGRFRATHLAERHGYATQASARAMGAGRELFALRKDGSEFPVEIGLNPVASDKAGFVLASITDISERKRTDRELAIKRDELAHLSRVLLLAELSGSLAHELNQPLSAILSNAQAALRFLDRSPPNLVEVRESLADIVENDKRAGEVIRRLRAMLRKEPAEHRPLDVNELVVDVLRIIRSDLLNRSVELTLDLEQDLPDVEGDRVQLQQVLLNLAMNGIDAMAGVEKPELIVRTRSTSDAQVRVSVSDNGCGIPAEDLARVFSPFVTTKASGMGLGLAVCTSIIESHRGAIAAGNNATRGATVWFVLPAAIRGASARRR